MAIAKRGNHITGLVGPVVLYEVNGKPAMRTKVVNRRKPDSPRLNQLNRDCIPPPKIG